MPPVTRLRPRTPRGARGPGGYGGGATVEASECPRCADRSGSTGCFAETKACCRGGLIFSHLTSLAPVLRGRGRSSCHPGEGSLLLLRTVIRPLNPPPADPLPARTAEGSRKSTPRFIPIASRRPSPAGRVEAHKNKHNVLISQTAPFPPAAVQIFNIVVSMSTSRQPTSRQRTSTRRIIAQLTAREPLGDYRAKPPRSSRRRHRLPGDRPRPASASTFKFPPQTRQGHHLCMNRGPSAFDHDTRNTRLRLRRAWRLKFPQRLPRPGAGQLGEETLHGRRYHPQDAGP